MVFLSFRFNFRTVALGILVAVAPLASSVSGQDSRLVKTMCIIDAVERHEGRGGLAEMFAHMVHFEPSCDDGRGCMMPLQKRTRVYDIVNHSLHSDSISDTSVTMADLESSGQVREITGLDHGRVILDRGDVPAPDQFEMVYVQTVDDILAHSGLPVSTFSQDIKEGEICEMKIEISDPDKPQIARLYRDFNATPEDAVICTRTAFLRQLGLRTWPKGETSFFDEGPYAIPADPPVYHRFSVRDVIMLDLLYLPAFKSGMSVDESKQITEKLIQEQCN